MPPPRSTALLIAACSLLLLCACDGGFEERDAGVDADTPSSPCDGVTCSDHGTCIVDSDRAWCACFDGYHAEGLSCRPDNGTDGGLDGCVPEAELCNGLDDDCNAATPDGAGDPEVGVPCDGDDSDRCTEGVTVCTSSGIECGDDSDDSIETCNGIDDDCDGEIDTGATCPCDMDTLEGHAYLFCSALRSWTAAQTFCADVGYTLVTIDGDAENAFVYAARRALAVDRWWIGLNDQDEEGVFVWASTGLEAAYTNWETDEPNDFGGAEDCTEMRSLGEWNDESCARAKAFACEAE